MNTIRPYMGPRMAFDLKDGTLHLQINDELTIVYSNPLPIAKAMLALVERCHEQYGDLALRYSQEFTALVSSLNEKDALRDRAPRDENGRITNIRA